MATKKREDEAKPKKAKAGTASKTPRRAAGGATGQPRIRTHATGSRPNAAGSRPIPAGPRPSAPRKRKAGESEQIAAAVKAGRGARGPALRKAPLGAPKRAAGKRPAPLEAVPEPSSAARELALNLASAGLEKKAIGIEILDVTGRVDYADFLVVMTGRSDRHVHAIATGLEEAMRRRKLSPLSMEGLTAATWVLIDFGDVVVHVFQEDARSLYDIEGLWIDAGRVPVPAEGPPPGMPVPPTDRG